MRDNTRAELLFRFRKALREDAYTDAVVWKLPHSVLGSEHRYKYRLALVIGDECVMRYDNERGKGDHRHIFGREEPFEFTTLPALLDAFEADVTRIME